MAINYVEKGSGLHKAIFAAGHTLVRRNNEWVASDESAVQAIIDAYDPLPAARAEAKARVAAQIQASLDFITSQYQEFEKLTFAQQRLEARAWEANNSAATPGIDLIATNEGISREAALASALAKTITYENLAFQKIGIRKALTVQIDAASTLESINAINYTG